MLLKNIKDRVNKSNIDDCIKEFEIMITDKHAGNVYEFKYEKLWNEAKEIHDIFLKIKIIAYICDLSKSLFFDIIIT